MLSNDELCIYPEYVSFSPLFYSMGSVTSYTTSLPSDGAVVLQIGNVDVIQKLSLGYLASVSCFVHQRSHPVNFPDILINTIKKLLGSVGITKSAIGIWEINDFFASIPSVISKILQIPLNTINLDGGNLSIGDTLAASSAKCVLSCSLLMQERNIEYGVVISTNCDGEIAALLLHRKSQLIIKN